LTKPESILFVTAIQSKFKKPFFSIERGSDLLLAYVSFFFNCKWACKVTKGACIFGASLNRMPHGLPGTEDRSKPLKMTTAFFKEYFQMFKGLLLALSIIFSFALSANASGLDDAKECSEALIHKMIDMTFHPRKDQKEELKALIRKRGDAYRDALKEKLKVGEDNGNANSSVQI